MRLKQLAFSILLAASLLIALGATTFAQTSRGTVSGVVNDPNGAVISGATVTLTNTQTSLARSTTTNGEGAYRFDAVELGTYTVGVSATGFGELSKTNIVVSANQISAVDAVLQPGGQQITVDVTADSGAILQTESPVRGGNIEAARITELPFAGRNPVALALTLPGVSSNRYGFGVGTFSVNGSRGRSNNFLIDGTENNDISVAGQAFQITNPDAVQEVSVQTSNFDSEFGRAGGAVVNTITKSGTNNFHGTASYLLDSTRDDAITNTQSLDPAVQKRGHPLPGTEQWFSGTLGGPLHLPRFGEGGPSYISGRNRTFFFVAAQRQLQNSTSQFSRVVPTAAGLATLRRIFPTGTNANLDTYLNIVSNVVGTANPFLIPIGNNTVAQCASVAGGSRPCVEFGTGFYSQARHFVDDQYQLRIDHRLGENDQLSGRYLYDNANDPLASSNFPGLETTQKNRYQNALLSETHVFSPSITNELRVAYNRIKLGFPADPSNPLGRTLPRFDITQISSIGIQTNLPQGRVANNYVLQDTMTYLRGNHTFRFGLDVLKQRSRQFAPIVERGLLTYTSGGGFTAFGNFLDNFGGGSGGARIDFGSAKYYPFLTRQAYFFQDRWRVNQDLTLTLGLRYENFGQPVNTLRTSAFTGLFNVDPTTLQGPFSQPNKAQKDNNNFAPTVGLAYSPAYENGMLGRLIGNRVTVLRMGYQIGYDSFFNNIASNAATSSPNVVATNINSQVSTAAPRGLSNLTSRLPTTARPLTPLDSQTLVTPNLANPYYQKWSVGIQRALPWNLVADASYVGTKGTRLFINEDLNPQVPATANAFLPGIQRITPAGFGFPTTCTVGGTVTAAQATSRFPSGSPCPLSGRLDNLQGSRLIRTNGGSSIYHSGQFQLSRRFVNGIAVTAAYTWSKLIDNASEVFGVGDTNQPQQASFPAVFGGERLDRAVSLFDRPHRASITYVYELPFMKNQEGFVGRLVGGWQLSGVTTFESGAPLTVVNGADADQVGGNLDRPLFNAAGQRGVRAVPAIATATSNPCSVAVGATFYTNPEAGGACIDPNTAQYIGLLAGAGRGNLGRNTLRTPGTNNWNVNILKRVSLTEGTHLEFRTEFYNIFNHPQYGQGSVSPFSPGDAGVSASVIGSTGGRFLQPQFADGGGRVVRYQLKFIF
ncbi:MAG: TonB-dependent receptor [Acidobacteria bacterium]|nr:TonB-dependent receptor [Acidobacteriota bacterium]